MLQLLLLLLLVSLDPVTWAACHPSQPVYMRRYCQHLFSHLRAALLLDCFLRCSCWAAAEVPAPARVVSVLHLAQKNLPGPCLGLLTAVQAAQAPGLVLTRLPSCLLHFFVQVDNQSVDRAYRIGE